MLTVIGETTFPKTSVLLLCWEFKHTTHFNTHLLHSLQCFERATLLKHYRERKQRLSTMRSKTLKKVQQRTATTEDAISRCQFSETRWNRHLLTFLLLAYFGILQVSQFFPFTYKTLSYSNSCSNSSTLSLVIVPEVGEMMWWQFQNPLQVGPTTMLWNKTKVGTTSYHNDSPGSEVHTTTKETRQTIISASETHLEQRHTTDVKSMLNISTTTNTQQNHQPLSTSTPILKDFCRTYGVLSGRYGDGKCW